MATTCFVAKSSTTYAYYVCSARERNVKSYNQLTHFLHSTSDTLQFLEELLIADRLRAVDKVVH